MPTIQTSLVPVDQPKLTGAAIGAAQRVGAGRSPTRICHTPEIGGLVAADNLDPIAINQRLLSSDFMAESFDCGPVERDTKNCAENISVVITFTTKSPISTV